MAAGRKALAPGEWTAPNAKKDEKAGNWRGWCRFGNFDGRTSVIDKRGRTKAIALKAVQDAVAKKLEEGRFLSSDARVRDVAELWLESVEPPEIVIDARGAQVAPKIRTRLTRQTWDSYHQIYYRDIDGALGQAKVTMLGTAQCERFLHGIYTGDVGLSTARLAKVVLSHILTYAARQDIIKYNPVNNVAPIPKKNSIPTALSDTTVADVQNAVRAWRAEPGLYGPANAGTLADIVDLLLATGCRIGEILALRWSDVDLTGDVGKIHITGTLIEPRTGPKYRQAHPKTSAGFRTIPIPRFAVDIFLRRSVASPEKNTVDAVFWSNQGTFLQASSVRRSLNDALATAGIKIDVNITPHSFRRTVATMLAREISDGAAASLLGHTSVQITHRHYIERLSMVEDYRTVLQRLAPSTA
ncbi:tyrosine-type recombinase/integrase [Specibacter sp. RAF43]|uniref:tyrosine-type recombinase/integrase n=1 Tax=Specibacter sp. RAF43 TaxID=3233057 RepID=UPI003F9A2421